MREGGGHGSGHLDASSSMIQEPARRCSCTEREARVAYLALSSIEDVLRRGGRAVRHRAWNCGLVNVALSLAQCGLRPGPCSPRAPAAAPRPGCEGLVDSSVQALTFGSPCISGCNSGCSAGCAPLCGLATCAAPLCRRTECVPAHGMGCVGGPCGGGVAGQQDSTGDDGDAQLPPPGVQGGDDDHMEAATRGRLHINTLPAAAAAGGGLVHAAAAASGGGGPVHHEAIGQVAQRVVDRMVDDRVGFAMALHPRLGAASPLYALDTNMFLAITHMAFAV